MSLSASLAAALSGLTAASRSTALIATNVANATTPGYARRDLLLSSMTLGGRGMGVQVVGILRAADPALTADRRLADAAAQAAARTATAWAALETALGTPEDPRSLGSAVAGFEAALIAAAGQPDQDSLLSGILSGAQGLADAIASAAQAAQDARADADAGIAQDVALLNRTLAELAGLNESILSATGAGRDPSSLLDQRDQLLDRIAGIVPLRVVPRDNGQISIYATGGAQLLDGTRPGVFGFTPAPAMGPGQSAAAGTLSGLTLNGAPLSTAATGGPISGGTLAARFDVRDVLAPQTQARLDAMARDLIERFADPALDPTLAPGAPGLFTDAGGPFDPAAESGLAQRLAINAAVDPAQGGAVWRLRDGIGASQPGATGDATLLNALRDRLVETRVPGSAVLGTSPRSVAGLASDLLSAVTGARVTAEGAALTAATLSDSLREQEAALGVDTDAEMQKLILVEQAYAANVQVITAVDEMIRNLLEL